MDRHLVFQDVDTFTCETVTADSYIVDCAQLTDEESESLEDCDMMGILSPENVAIIRRVGVPVADLWAAYEREQRVVAVSGGVFDVCDDGVVRLWTLDDDTAADAYAIHATLD